MFYKFTYKRFLFWKTYSVVGHKYKESQDKMIIFFKEGGLREIKNWKKCELRLGPDWYAETKREMEKAAGQPIA